MAIGMSGVAVCQDRGPIGHHSGRQARGILAPLAPNCRAGSPECAFQPGAAIILATPNLPAARPLPEKPSMRCDRGEGRQHYNGVRPNQSLGDLTPAEIKATLFRALAGYAAIH
jgi:hypothetical protein